jgi:hypothetical protein
MFDNVMWLNNDSYEVGVGLDRFYKHDIHPTNFSVNDRTHLSKAIKWFGK